MKCVSPYVGRRGAFGCKQCAPCLINRRNVWTHRLLLEQFGHERSCFVTLTYDDAHLPPDGSLSIRHYQLFLKKFRKGFPPRSIRYFFVGEYGKKTVRPHYHAAIFGTSCLNILGCREARKRKRYQLECSLCRKVREAWDHGAVIDVGELNPDSAQYIAKYVTKKMLDRKDERLKGKLKEFARMSLKPGIGANAVSPLVDLLTTEHGCDELVENGVSSQLKVGCRSMPLGIYLRKKVSEALGIPWEEVAERSMEEARERLRTLYAEAKEDPKAPLREWFHDIFEFKKQVLVYKNGQYVRNMQSRVKLFEGEGKL